MQVKNVVVISGASRGLGAELARALALPDTLLITLSRSALSWPLPKAPGLQHHHLQADLATPEGASQAGAELARLVPAQGQRYILINNAGTVDPILPSSELTNTVQLARAYQLNVLTPMTLSAHFLRQAPSGAQRQILNISSGAGRHPVAGWAVYGSSKAALDFYTQVVHLENPDVAVASLAPGVIDTDMQTHIRTHDARDFPTLNRFIELHQHRQLSAAAQTAARIVAYLDSPEFGQVTLDDIRHYE